MSHLLGRGVGRRLVTRIPARPWSAVAQYVNESWLPDSQPHMAVIAQTRGGKSSLIRHGLLPLVPHDRVLMLDSKGGTDPAWHGWGREVEASYLRVTTAWVETHPDELHQDGGGVWTQAPDPRSAPPAPAFVG